MDPNKKQADAVVAITENSAVVESIQQYLKDEFENVEFHFFTDSDEAKRSIFPLKPSVVITDWQFREGPSGAELLSHLSRDKYIRNASILILSSELNSRPPLNQLDSLERIEVINPPYEFVDALRDCGLKEKSIRTRRLQAGEILFHEGDLSQDVYIVNKGELAVYREKNGEKKILATIHEKQMVGEMAFFSQAARSASVEAKIDTEVLELNIQKFKSEMDRLPPWLKIMIESLLNHLKGANEKLVK